MFFCHPEMFSIHFQCRSLIRTKQYNTRYEVLYLKQLLNMYTCNKRKMQEGQDRTKNRTLLCMHAIEAKGREAIIKTKNRTKHKQKPGTLNTWNPYVRIICVCVFFVVAIYVPLLLRSSLFWFPLFWFPPYARDWKKPIVRICYSYFWWFMRRSVRHKSALNDIPLCP